MKNYRYLDTELEEFPLFTKQNYIRHPADITLS